MTILAELLSTLFERRNLPGASKLFSNDKSIEALCADLLSSKGEVSGYQIAAQILNMYETGGDEKKLAFFHHIAEALDIDIERARAALEAYGASHDPGEYRALMRLCEAPRQEFFRRLNQVPGATARLVRMRSDFLRLAKGNKELARIDHDFRHLFQSWFNRGFLVMRPISWQSPAHILEKIIAYEAVHAIESWDDLRGRLEPEDRRCFAFFHPVMPDEPLIFVEVALTKGIPGSIGTLLDTARAPLAAREADTAAFYSISNCQQGLAGISFGNSLIKQVVEELSVNLPQIKQFATLSPIPRLVEWAKANGLEAQLAKGETREKLAAYYLLLAKADGNLPFDPVARFHLNNGASIHAVHPRADASKKGVEQSAGAMVNYLYDLKRISENHERYASGERVAASTKIEQLARNLPKVKAEDEVAVEVAS